MLKDMKYKKILIKISGESLKSHTNGDIIDKSTIFNLINQIKSLKEQEYKIGIVIGGGNIWRGKISSNIGLDSCTGDYMGMMATIINAIALRKMLLNNNIDSELYSSLFIPSVSKYINYLEMIKDFKDKVLVFGGGTGYPNFSTDSSAALRALELDCDLLLIAKNGVDGVFDKDPKKFKNALFFENLTYDNIIEKKLLVMDQTALTLCKERNIEIRVFNIDKENAFINVLENKIRYTKIKD